MGLDMYLVGTKVNSYRKEEKIDGFPVKSIELELGYWRKHPNLHGLIVNRFADGVDQCQQIELDIDRIQEILLHIQEDALPYTEGFFFGRSPSKDEGEFYQEQKDFDLEVFNKALKWLEVKNQDAYRSIYYRASW